MKRPVGFVATVVLLTIGSIACFSLALLLIIVYGFGSSQPNAPQIPLLAFVLPTAYFSALGFWAVTNAQGIWRTRSWARISLLAFAGLLAVMHAMSLAILSLAFNSLARDPSAQPIPISLRIVFYGACALPLAVAIWWLIYFTRPKTKKLFQRDTDFLDENRRPLSIFVIAWHLIAVAALSMYAVWEQWPAAFLGWLLAGWSATIINVIWGAVSFYVGIGLLRKKPQFHSLAVWYMWFTVVSYVAFFVLPGAEKRIVASWESIPIGELDSSVIEPLGPFIWMLYAVGLGSFFVALWYLHTRKERYLDACAMATHPGS